MSGKHVTFFCLSKEQEEKEMVTPKNEKRRQRLNDDEAEIIRLMRVAQIKPQIDTSLLYREAPLMTPRHRK